MVKNKDWIGISIHSFLIIAVLSFSVNRINHTDPDLPADKIPAYARETVADLSVMGVAGPKHPRPWVALTFDDGPDPRYTPAVLDILGREGIKATFFVIGGQVQEHPDILMDTYLGGHELGNHTWSHRTLTKVDWTGTVSEISKAQDEVAEAVGIRMDLFRPPRGKWDADDVKAAKAMGYRIVMWNVCLENRLCKTPASMVDRVMDTLVPMGIPREGIILMHDGNLDRKNTIEALPMLIRQLKKNGYVFKTAGEFIGSNP